MGGHKLLGRNLMIYGANNPINCMDSSGTRVFFINGVNNIGYEGDKPQYVKDFEHLYELFYQEDIVHIPVYVGDDFWQGSLKVYEESIGNDVYTTDVVDAIQKNLEESPLLGDEKLTLLGYSGGGILALNASRQFDNIDNIVLELAPVHWTLFSEKPWGSKGGAQLSKYLAGGALEPGYSFFPIMEIPIVADIKMAVVPSASEPGVANYFFYMGPTAAIRECVLSRDVKKEVAAHLSVAVVGAGLIITGTILEDIFTGGAGLLNDLPSFLGAASLGASVLFA